METITRCTKISGLRKTLKSLPSTLRGTYDRLIDTIEEDTQNRDDALRVLQWLCYVKSPPTLAQLVEVVATDPDPDGDFVIEDRPPDPYDLLMICSNFITIVKVRDRSGDRLEVRLAHFSVQEYLLSEQYRDRSYFEERKSHQVMANTCVKYLLYTARHFDLAAISDHAAFDMPLASYAAFTWYEHVRKADLTEKDKLTMTVAHVLLGQKSSLAAWLCLQGQLDNRIMRPPLSFAAELGLAAAVRLLLEEGADPNHWPIEWGVTPLQAACLGGHRDSVIALLEAGADHTLGEPDDSCLTRAARGGDISIVRLLLEHDSGRPGRGAPYTEFPGSPLEAAVEHRSCEVVELLLANGAHVNALSPNYGTALNAAAFQGNAHMVKRLLQAGANPCLNTRDGTALHTAVDGKGDPETIKILLQYPLDIDLLSGESRQTPLHIAIEEGHIKAARILIDAGADTTRPEIMKAARDMGYTDLTEYMKAERPRRGARIVPIRPPRPPTDLSLIGWI